jgi:hypothetical protein
MKKILDLIKKTYNTVKDWIVGNGIEGVAGIVLGLVLWTLGYKVYAGFAFGVFATINWKLLKAWVMVKVNKVKEVTDKVKDITKTF